MWANISEEIGQQLRGGIMHTDTKVESGPLFVIEALADLYHLLENYAPSWYRKEHHEKAAAALSAVKAE
jgi:hypothetical protein